MNDSERWILSFYRTSEISGALFFGRLARALRPSGIQRDMTKHFADESQHAWYWTRCLEQMGERPYHLGASYQDQYLLAAGLPANLMEVLAITTVFERRVVNQYTLHRRVPDLHPAVVDTLNRIMEDEVWHIQWVGDALKEMAKDYGAEYIEATLERYRAADREVYAKTMAEHAEHVEALRLDRLKRSGRDGS